MTLGHMRTTKSYRETVDDLEDEFHKWGVTDYFIPTYRQVEAKSRERRQQAGGYVYGTTYVAISFTKNAQTIPLRCEQFARLEDNIRSIWRIVEALRLADQRGILVEMAAAAQKLALPDPDDPYQVLKVEKTASLEVIRSAYRDAVKDAHPDHGGTSLEFQRVQRAGEALGIA